MRLTQEQLAERAGLGVRTLRDLEAGRVRRPQRESVRLLAEALGLSGDQRRRLLAAVPALGVDPPAALWGVVPAQLPADVADFTGREAAVGELAGLLAGGDGSAAVVVVSVAGRAGVGKTALAVHVAHRVRSWFPDGQLYVNLRGAEAQALDPAAVLGRFLQGLGVEPGAVPRDAEQRGGLFRSLLAERRVLVVLDNAASEAQVRPLLPAGSGCAVLVTSRRRLAGLEGARRVDLDVLDEQEALTLLGRVAGAGRVAGDPDAAAVVVGYCGRLPLAVRIAGAKLAARPGWSVGELAGRLADQRRRLDELKAGDLEVRASAALSYRTLSDDARRGFRLLGLLDAPDFAGWVAAALLDADLDRAQELVDELVDAQLLDTAGRDATGTTRYRFHDLLRVYARELAQHDHDADAALSRALSGWLSLTEHAEQRLPDIQERIRKRAPRSWSAPSSLAERLVDDPLAWFEAEQQALVHAVEQACGVELVPLGWELAARLGSYLVMRSQWEPWRHTHEAALATCRRVGDRSGEATMLHGLGSLAQHTSGEAVAYYERALALFREAGDEVGEARVLADLPSALHRLMRFDEALAAADQALDLARRHGLRGTETNAVMGRAEVLRELARPEEAIAAGVEALALLAGRNARRSEAQVRFSLALARRALGDFESAARLLEESLHATRELGDRYGEAYVLVEYAQVQVQRRLVEDAEQALTASLELSQHIPAPSLEARAASALGHLRVTQGRAAEAGEWFARAERLWDGLGNAARAAETRAARSGAAQGPVEADGA